MTLDTSTIQPNEVVKAEDWSFGLDAQVNNIGVALASVLESRQSFVIGGKVSPYGGGLNVSIAPLFGVVNETINSFLDTEAIEPVPISPSPGNTRIDIIEVQGEWEEYDQQQRAFMDFETDIQTFQNINTKKRHKVNVRVKTGTPGSVSAPTVSDGWVKLAEIHVPADAVEITENDIKNITADIAGIENTNWTNEKTATYNIGYISDVNNRFRTAHNNDGTHKERAITPNAIAIGTGNNELSGSNLPTGKIVTVSGQQLANTSTLADTIISLATKITDLFNKYLVNGAYNLNGEVSISDVVDAGTSTLTNAIKIGAAGDGTGYIKIGNRQVLNFTANTVQAATGYNATNALDFITKSVTDALNETVTNLSEDFEEFKKNLNSTTYSNTVLSRFKVGEQLYAATTGNITLSGLQTIDGVPLSAGVKVLVKDQTNEIENGIYEANANVWQRDASYLTSEGIKYKLFEISNGTQNKGKMFFTPLEEFEVGVDSLLFEEAIYSIKKRPNTVVLRNSTGEIEDFEEVLKNISSYIYITAKDNRWLRFDFNASNKKTLKILQGTYIKVNDTLVFFDKDTTYDLSTQITENGKDYYVFLDAQKNLTVSTIRTETTGKKRIGQFHTLCVDAGTMTAIAPTEKTAIGEKYLIKEYSNETDSDFYNFYNKDIDSVRTYTYYNVATVEHPLSGFQAGDILPESVWCLTFHPSCENWNGMVYDKDTNIAVDIYLQSGKGKSTASVYGATHTVSRQQWNHQEDLRAVGKRMLKDFEFTSIASGSNEKTNIQGTNDKGTVGGNVDTANRRMISFIGCEECCGYLWQWIDEISDGIQVEWNNEDGHGVFGQQYWQNRVLLAGGPWDNGASCGSRSRIAYYGRSNVHGYLGSRGSAGVIR